jgi:hypothetical protein
MLNQPTVFEAAHIEYKEVNGFAAAYLFTSCSHSNPNFVAGLNTYSSMPSCSPSTPERAAVIWPFRMSPL